MLKLEENAYDVRTYIYSALNHVRMMRIDPARNADRLIHNLNR
jgi:hypothetical protein